MSLIAEPEKSETAKVKKQAAPRATAETMATKQRDISVSEFFAKNRHLLGFDNARKALLTTVKEAVDNSLDACEEAGILPDITVVIEDLQPDRAAAAKSSKYRVSVVDNGPGIVRKQVENIFGRLLYGSKFHRLKMSRGQQGIGISAAGMYGLITTGKPMVIHTRPSPKKPAHHIELAMNTKTNRAEVTVDDETEDFPPKRFRGLTPGTRELSQQDQFLSEDVFVTGTSVSIELDGRYQKGRGSVDEFLELTAIANPHARIVFVPPSKVSADEVEEDLLPRKRGAAKVEDAGEDRGGKDGEAVAPVAPVLAAPEVTAELGGVVVFPRGVTELPPETKEIMPHPKGIELGILLQMLKEAESESATYTLYNFLQDKFSRVSAASAGDFCKAIGVTSRTRAGDIDHAQAEKLFKILQDSKLPPPPTDCLAPIGVQQLLKGMFKGVRAEFYAASSREAAVYRGRPFLIESAIAFGGELPGDDSARVIRFANRVPLLFQQSSCSSFKAVTETKWKNYDLQQPRDSVPIGPIVIMIHMASVWVPFTSESKEAIADYDEIRKEMKLALMECGRKLGTYLNKRSKMRREAERRDVFERYIGEIAKSLNAITGKAAKDIYDALLIQARKRTAIADLQLDDEGKKIKDAEEEEGVIIVPPVASPIANVAAPYKSKGKQIRTVDEDEPGLMDVAESKESKRASKPMGEPAPAKNPKSAAKPAMQQKHEPKADAKAPAKSETTNATPAARPRMRLDPKTGKLAPVDDGPKLF